MTSSLSSNKFIYEERLDKVFIEKIVGEPVKEYSVSAGVNSGDNFMGVLLSLWVKTVSNEEHRLLIKSAVPLSGTISKNTVISAKFMVESKVFPKEIVYYKQIRPLFEKLFANNEEPRLFFSSPKMYACLHDESRNGLDDYIVLEDLRHIGYTMADKVKGLDYAEVRASLKNLVLLHATSYFAMNGVGCLSEKWRKIVIEPRSFLTVNGFMKDLLPGADGEAFYDNTVYAMVNVVKENGQEGVAETIRKIVENGFSRIFYDLCNKTTEQGKFFRVFVHGDIWPNNILIRRGPDGTVENVRFIDFAMSRFGNIYEDLHYFLFSSTTSEFRRVHLKSCLKIYYKEFEDVLKEIRFPGPEGFSEEQLISTFYETLEYALVTNLMAIPWHLGIPPPTTPEEKHVQEQAVDWNLSPNYQEMYDGMVVDLNKAIRNSPIAMQRLDDMIWEMVDYGVIK